jgi:hypothetical protein
MPRWALSLLVAAVTLIVHLRACRGEFVFHDDYRYVVNNEAIDHVGNPLRFFTDLSTLSPQSPTKDIYRPVRTLSYAVITKLFGKESATPFHAAAVLLHVATTVLLLLLLLRAGLGAFPATVGALFFGLSPVTVEVTAWTCSLGDAWCGLFVALSLLAYTGDRRVLALLALVAALFSKEHAVVVPGLWILWDLLVRPERLRGRALLRTAAAGIMPAAVAVAAFLLFRADVVGAKTSQVPVPIGGSRATAALTMTSGLGWYAATILFPYEPTFDAVVRVPESVLEPGVLSGLLVLGALAWGIIRGPRLVRLGAAWFLVALVPVHNVFVTLKIPTADRFLYLPLMGVAFLVGELARRTIPFSARWMPPALLLVGVLAAVRIGDWRNSETLWRAGLRVDPKSPRLIWEEAAIGAERAVRYSLRGDDVAAERIGARAVAGYELYLKNSVPEEQTQVYVELGDLLDQLARGRARFAAPEQINEALNAALRAYLKARAQQEAGIGRTTEEETRHVAEQIVRIAAELVQTAPEPGPTIQAGLEAADFLKRKYGVDDTGARIVFRLADSVRVRGQEPAKAREGFDWILDALDRMDPMGTRFPFIRAQALFYRAVLKDREFDRPAMERAFQLYLEAAKDPVTRLRALAYAGRCACTIGSLFKDPKETELGRNYLASVAAVAARDGLRLDPGLKREIESLEIGCGG